MPSYTYDLPTRTWESMDGGTNVPDPPPPVANPDWSDPTPPWASTDTGVFTSGWPASTTYVNLSATGATFKAKLDNTLAGVATGSRAVVVLPAGDFQLLNFAALGGTTTYDFGYYSAKLQGFLGAGPDQTFVTMAANAINSTQLGIIQALTPSSSASPLQMGIIRFDGLSAASPVLCGGLTFRAYDQPNITAQAAGASPAVVVPQPAPHQGVVLYQGSYGQFDYVRFQGAGRACTSSPPFEMANVTTQYGSTQYNNCEFDGRLSPAINAAQPRRCCPIMGNNETLHTMTDCWIHHSNVSRYAVNDQNRNTTGTYTLTRVKANQITNTHNTDPAINGGATLGGYTNATPFGFESCNGTITFNNCVIEQNNSFTDGQIAQHIQLTSVGSRNPQGGRLTVNGGTFRNTAWPQLDGWVEFRIPTGTFWYSDGLSTTLHVVHPNGQTLAPYVYTGAWPPTAGQLTTAGVSNTTHYLVRTS